VAAIIYRKLDENGDYTFGRRDGFYSGVEAVAQAVKTRLLHFRGEWWENIRDGTPFFQEVAGQFFASSNAARRVDLIFSRRINGTIGVVEITAFDSRIDPQTRIYSASITVRTIYDAVFQLNIIGAGGGLLDITLQGG
jgi:hypothetical protein